MSNDEPKPENQEPQSTKKYDGINIGGVVGDHATVIINKISLERDNPLLRTWWHDILRKHGYHSCFAIFLLLPSDKEAITYLSEFGKELDLISGENCLVIAFGKTEFKGPKFDEKAWITTLDEHVTEGISIKIAKLFDVEFTQFPCLIIFKDIRSPEHIIVTLKGVTSKDIAEKLREVFSIINIAISKNENPVHALSSKRKKEKFQKTGLSILSEVQSFAGKTLDTMMEAFIKTSIS